MDTVSERMNIFYMVHYLTIVIGAYTLEIILSACYQAYTGPLKKLFHYTIFQKFFHIFLN